MTKIIKFISQGKPSTIEDPRKTTETDIIDPALLCCTSRRHNDNSQYERLTPSREAELMSHIIAEDQGLATLDVNDPECTPISDKILKSDGEYALETRFGFCAHSIDSTPCARFT